MDDVAYAVKKVLRSLCLVVAVFREGFEMAVGNLMHVIERPFINTHTFLMVGFRTL